MTRRLDYPIEDRRAPEHSLYAIGRAVGNEQTRNLENHLVSLEDALIGTYRRSPPASPLQAVQQMYPMVEGFREADSLTDTTVELALQNLANAFSLVPEAASKVNPKGARWWPRYQEAGKFALEDVLSGKMGAEATDYVQGAEMLRQAFLQRIKSTVIPPHGR